MLPLADAADPVVFGGKAVALGRAIRAGLPVPAGVALSVDTADSHNEWIKDIEETQKTVVGFPIVADADRCRPVEATQVRELADGTRFTRVTEIRLPNVRIVPSVGASAGQSGLVTAPLIRASPEVGNDAACTPWIAL